MACSKLEARGHLLHKTGTPPKQISRECRRRFHKARSAHTSTTFCKYFPLPASASCLPSSVIEYFSTSSWVPSIQQQQQQEQTLVAQQPQWGQKLNEVVSEFYVCLLFVDTLSKGWISINNLVISSDVNTDYRDLLKAHIKEIWKFGSMRQTKYALAIPKNLWLGVDFWQCGEVDFLIRHPLSIDAEVLSWAALWKQNLSRSLRGPIQAL